MTAVPPTVDAQDHPDSGDLTGLGYRQELHRGLGPFASFASGFSFVSILTTVFQLFIIGFGFAGPAYIWTWPIVFVGQFCVCLCFAELSARYPVAGAIYQWSRRVSTDPLGWMAGWLMQIGYIISVAAIAIALQAVLPEVWSGFQLVGTDTSPTSEDGALNAIILGSICIALCVVIASFGVTKMAMLTRIGVTIEIIGVVVVLVLLFTHVVRGPAVVFQTNGTQGDGSYALPFLASMLMAAYVMYGFDSAAELSEETNDPRRTAPRAITRCMLVSAVGGGLMILGTLLAAPDITAPELSTVGIAYVLTAVAGDFWGRVVLAVVGISIFSAALAISASATRVMFSMARDGQLPFARALAKVSPRTHTPILPGIVVGVLSIGVLLINLGQTSVFATVTAISVVVVYLAYLFVTIPLLVQRLRRNPAHVPDPAYFTLGRWGLPVNAVAVVFGVFMLVNIGWPRAAIYDLDGRGWYFRWSAPLSIIVIVGLGLVAYRFLPAQRAAAAEPGRASGSMAAMVNVHIDPAFDDAERRRRLYGGDVLVYTHVPEVAAFAAYTRDMITELFAPHDPIMINEVYSPDELADLLIEFKPRWIHDPRSMEHVRAIAKAFGAVPEKIHADVPKLRTAFPEGGLSTGIAYAFQAHRDTWYAGPKAQLNWWMPVWPVAQDNVMEFYPHGFGAQVENNSGDYDYYVANAWRGRIKDFSGGKDVRVHPAPVHGIGPDVTRLTVVPPLGGIMLFSGDQLHASVPNTSGITRYSIDFRTVNVDDVHAGVGAPVADVACTGTALRDFKRLTDGASFTDDEVAPHDSESAAGAGGVKEFVPTT